MKLKFFLFVCAVLAIAGCQSKVQSTPSAWVVDHTTPVKIVIPATEANQGINRFLKETALLLQRGLKESYNTNAVVEVEGTTSGGSGNTIYLGNTDAIRKQGFEPLKFKNWDYVIAVRGNNLYIAGSDRDSFGSSKKVRNHRDAFLGTVTGAIRFMEKYMDARFLMPGTHGIDFIAQKRLRLADGVTQYGTSRMITDTGRTQEMFYDLAIACPGGKGAYKQYGGHLYYPAVPVKKYLKKHPEYFAANAKGERSGLGNHLCISNKAVQDLLFAEMLRSADEGAEIIQIGPTDGYVPCRCAKCVAYGVPGNDYGEKTWILHCDLAKRLEKERPGKMVAILCYPPNSNPPKTFKKFPDNVMIHLCKTDPATLEEWSHYQVKGGYLAYIYNWGCYRVPGYTPKCAPADMAEQARLFVKYNIKGHYRCGFGELIGMEGPAYYVYGKVLENPGLDAESLVQDYCRRAYHESTAPMQTFFKTLHERVRIFALLLKANYPLTQRNYFAAAYPPEVMDTLRKNLERAEKLARQPKVKARLSLVRAEFDYLKTITDGVAFYNAYRATPNWTTFDQLATAIDRRNALIQKMAPKGKTLPLKSYPYSRFFDRADTERLMNNGTAVSLGSPFNWNMKMLKANKVLPGTIQKKLNVYKTTGIVPFNHFDSGVWKAVPWNELNGIQLDAIKEKSRFKVLYDDKNFYMAYVSEVDPKKTFNAMGPDGPAWRADSIEIFLDPAGERQSAYHLIYNPVPNSYFDAAINMITDSLHPLYGKEDPSWNGKWSYQTRREGGLWYSLATIPFATLKCPVPKPGTVWTMNTGRESRIIGGNGNEDAELSLWSPNLETRFFADREAYGEMIFQ